MYVYIYIRSKFIWNVVHTQIEMNIIVDLDIKLSIPNGNSGGEIQAGLGGELVIALNVVQP